MNRFPVISLITVEMKTRVWRFNEITHGAVFTVRLNSRKAEGPASRPRSSSACSQQAFCSTGTWRWFCSAASPRSAWWWSWATSCRPPPTSSWRTAACGPSVWEVSVCTHNRDTTATVTVEFHLQFWLKDFWSSRSCQELSIFSVMSTPPPGGSAVIRKPLNSHKQRSRLQRSHASLVVLWKSSSLTEEWNQNACSSWQILAVTSTLWTWSDAVVLQTFPHLCRSRMTSGYLRWRAPTGWTTSGKASAASSNQSRRLTNKHRRLTDVRQLREMNH